jgi:hypothetical protein
MFFWITGITVAVYEYKLSQYSSCLAGTVPSAGHMLCVHAYLPTYANSIYSLTGLCIRQIKRIHSSVVVPVSAHASVLKPIKWNL